MTAHSRFRIAAVIGAVLAPFALVAITSAPADAASKHKHEVYMYKMSDDLRLAGVGPDGFGDSNTPSLSCYDGDIALDGMWNVKHVDQYHPPAPDPDEDPDYPSTSTLGGIYNDERDVFVEASYPDTSDEGTWHFRFDNRAYGDAQVKLFVTCIRGYVENTNGHHHQVKVRDLPNATYPTTASDYTGRYRWDSTNGVGFTCDDPDEYFVAPGFNLALTTDDHRLVASYPTHKGRSWVWEFASFDPDSLDNPMGEPGGTGPISVGQNIEFYGKCIERQTAGSHKHAIVMKHLPKPDWSPFPDTFADDGYQVSIPLGDAKEVQYSCDTDHWQYSGYKAMVGWFFMTDHWEHNWYYGMEPRPKTRAYQFWNGGAVSAKVNLGVLCINSRTANPTI